MVTITAVDNAVDALDKEVTVSATATNTQGITAPPNVTLTITDDDAPELSIDDASVDEGDSGESATLTFTVTLTPAATLPVTVDWATSDGTAEAGTDYTAESGSLKFATGDDTKTITVTVTGDDVDEPNETITVTLTNESGATLGDATGTGTITDDDGPPAVTLVLTPATIGEAGGKSTVTATLDHPSSQATTVTVSAAPVDPAVANDYTLSTNTTLTIAAGETTSRGVVTITAANNDVDTLDKEVTVSATATNSQGVTAPQNATLTITDDDAPELSIGDASVTEGDLGESATLTFTVTLDPAATLPVTVDWATSDGTATAGTDYTTGSGSLRFDTGDESKTVAVTVTGDDADEPNETVTVTLSNESGATLGDATGTGTITDDDGPPAVTLVLTPASISENGGKSTVTATLDHPSSEATTVTVAATPVSPALASDYTLSTNTTLTIAAGQTTSTGAVTITAVNNAVDALDKEVTVSATATNSQGVTAPQDVTLTIEDDDAPELSIGDASVGEGDSGDSPTLAFTVTLSPAATLPVTVDWATSDGTATAGTDYTAGNGSLTFNTGDETKTITVTVTGDDTDEPNETLTVTLTNAPGATLGKATGTGTITDDDDAPTVTLVLTPSSIGEAGGKSTVTATLDRASSEATTVTVAATPVSPALAGDYTLSTNTTLTIAAGQTTSTGAVTIIAVNNDVDALDKEVTVSATATNSQGVTAPQDVTLTITDDDAPALSIGDASVGEGDSGDSPTLAFTVTLSPAATLPVTVDWATSDGTATAGTDYTAASGTLTFDTGDETKNITVTVTGDDTDEPNETLTVTLTNAPGATLGKATGTGTITDDDDAPTVTLVLTPSSIGEAGGKSTVTATLDHPSSQATTVTVSAAPVTPAVATDYTLSTTTTLTIPAHSLASTGTVTITAANNTVYEGDKTVTVSATATNDQGVTAPQDVTLTITEDDTASEVTVAAETATITEGEDAVFILTRASADITTPLVVDFTVADPNTVLDQAAPTTATILADETTVKVTLATDDDAAHEPDATVTLTVTDGDLYDLGSESSATVTVEDDDPAGQVSAADAAVTVAADEATITEGEDAVFTLTRTGSASEELVVTIAVTGGGEVLADEPPTEATFGAGAATTQVTLATADDEVDEPDATVTVTVTDGDAYYPGDPAEAKITVQDDDDTPKVTLVLTPATITEAGGKSTVTASLDRASSAATTVTVAVTPVDPAVAGDYTLSGTALTIAAGEMTSTGEVTITAVDNDVDALDRTVTASATAENDQGITNPDAVTLTITDDEVPVVTVAAETATVTEGAEAAFTLTRVGDLSGELAVTFGVTGGGAVLTDTPPTDATFGANAATVRVALATEDDQQDEPNATLTLALSDGADYDLGTTSEAEVTVEDNDDAPTVTLVLTPASIGENGGKSTVTATLDHPSSQATTVTVTAAPVSPSVAGDYTLSTNKTLTIAADATTSTGVVTITAVDNAVDALDKEVTVSATATNSQGVTAPQDVTLTITDDDAPELSIDDASVTEGAEGESVTLTFTVTLDPAATLPVTVDWKTADGTAEAGTDYTAGNGSLTFNTGDETKTITVRVTGDDTDEPNETFTVTLTNASGATFGDATGTGTITDDDDAPTVTLVLTPASIGENGGKSTVTATLDRPSSEATTVTVAAVPVDPAVANDYTLSTNKTLTIAAGETTSTGVVTITAVNNDVDALDKEVTVSATATNTQGITAPQNETLTITDDDAPELSIDDASVTEGAEGESVTLTFTVTLDPAATLPVTVDWATSDGTAEAGTDYTAGSGSLKFDTGDDSKTITVTVTGDDTDEPNETVTVTLTNASGATITDATGTGTITDDDDAPTVTLVLTPASIGENGGKSTVTATLDHPSSQATTVTVAAAPVSPALASDYTLSTNTTLTIAAGETTSTGVVTITAVNNAVDALDKEVTVSATATNTQGITAPQNVTLTITDDDAPELSIGDASVGEGDEGESATLTFTVTLSPAATLPVTVDWATSDGTATAGTDYTAGNGSLRFDTGDDSKTITVTVTGDDADEPNETVTVTLTNESGATLGKATGTGKITDDDGPPAVTLVLTPASIGENGGKSTVTATLDRASSEATTVTVAAAPVDPAVAGDYTLVGSQLTIAADSLTSTGVVTITAVNNDVDALDKEVTVSATATNAQGVTDPDSVTLTIEDDDAPELSIGDASVGEGDSGDSPTLTFTVTLDPAATLPVTVDWATSDGTAEAGTDYTAGSGSLRFATGDDTKTITVTVTGDDADEPNETITVTLSNESGATLGDATGTGTITDDDDAPTVTLVLTPSSIGENGGKSTVTATLDRPSSQATTVTVAAAPVTPAVANDYTLSTNTTLTIAAGATTSTGVVTITAVDNDVDALDKEVTVSATAENTQGITAPQNVTLTITDDDAPELSIGDASVTEGDEGESATLTFTVTLTPAATLPVTVDWATADGTATAGTDYTTGSGSLRFDTGDESKTVAVTVTGDDADEPNETLTVTLTNESGATLGDATGTVTITDDDGPPTVTLVLTPASIGEAGGKSTVTATLDHPSSQATTVTVAAAPVTPAVANDYTLSTNKTLTIAAGATTSTGVVTITAADNDVDALDKEVTVSATAENTQGITAPQDVTLTITDDEPPVVTVAAETASVTEGEDAVFILTRASADIATSLVVDFTLADPDTVLDQEAPTTATILADETTVKVTLATDDDAAHEPPAMLTLTVTDGDDYELGALTSATVTVNDNDPQGQDKVSDAAVTVAADEATVTEGEDAVFTLTRTGDASEELVVTFTVTGDVAVLTDTPPTEATFNANADTVRVALATDDDTTDEPPATVTVTVTDGDDYYPGTTSDAEVTVEDNDGAPTVTLVLTPATIGEAGGKSTVTATLDHPSSAATTVTVSAAPVSPTVAGDYTLSTNKTLTIAAGATTSTGVVTITAVNNEVDALDKEVTVSATATNDQGITAPPNATLTITDDDAPALSIDDASVTEGDQGASATLTFTVTLDPAATLPVTVDWATSDGTATAGTDYTTGSGTLTFNTGDDTKTITVTVTGDDADEPNETVTVTLTNAPGATLSDATGTGTITDDDDAPTVTLVLTPASISENGGKSTVTATLDRASSEATTVTVSATPVAPALASDYTLSTNTTLTIAAGQTTSTGAVTITAVDNDVDALDKTVTVSATATNTQGITAPQDVTLTITDDDAPELAIGDASVSEGDAGDSPTLTFTVTLDPAATLPVTVDWATSDGTATAGTDYTAANGSLRFDTGDETKTITVTVTGDDADEPNETLTVTLTNESGATLGKATGTGTITDDDGPPAVTLVLTPASIGENGGKSTVTATLDRASSEATTVTVSATPVSPALASDYTLSTNTTLTIAAGQMTSTGAVTITAVDNDVDALDKEVTVSATATNSQGVTAPQDVTLTIEDDDMPELAIGDASVGEGDTGDSPTLTFTVTLDPAATLPVTVDWATSDGTATAGTDYTAGNGSLTFNTGDDTKTITVTVTGDDADEPNETLTVTLSNESGATITDATGTGTITDDDDAPTVTLNLTPASIGENGGKSTVTATLDHPSSQGTTVTVAAAPVTPTVAGDYTLVGSQLTIAAGATTSTGVVTITAANNTVYEGDKTVTVSATATNDQGVTAPQDVTLTITDDDAAPVVTVAAETATITEGGDAVFILTRASADITTPLVVDFTVADPNTVLDQAAPTTATIPADQTTVKVTLATDDDAAHEADATVTLTVTDGDIYDLGTVSSATVTVEDDDPLGRVSAADAAVTVAADATVTEGGDAVFTLTRTRGVSEELVVTIAVTGGGESAGR